MLGILSQLPLYNNYNTPPQVQTTAAPIQQTQTINPADMDAIIKAYMEKYLAGQRGI